MRIPPIMKKRKNVITRDSGTISRRKNEERFAQLSDRIRQLQQEGKKPNESLEQVAMDVIQNIDTFAADPQEFNKMVPDDFSVEDMDMLFSVLPDDFSLDRKIPHAVPDETEVPSEDAVAEIMKKSSNTTHERGRKDPLRMYMLTIGSVPLLTKEGEVDIA